MIGHVRPLRLDRLGHRQAFDDGPFEPRRLDHRLPLGDGIGGPFRAGWIVMQGRHHPCCANLREVAQHHGVMGAEPAPAFLHGCHPFRIRWVGGKGSATRSPLRCAA